MRIGGLPFDLTPGWTERLSEFVDDLPARIDDYEQLLTDNRIWKKRTVGIGVISGRGVHRVGPDRADPARLGRRVGPAPRAALRVLRRARLRRSRRGRTATPTTATSCGVQEMRQSARILRQCLEQARAGRDPRQGPARHQAAGRGGLRLDRVAQGRARLLLRLQRHQPAVPDALPAAVVHQPAGSRRGWRRAT